MTTWQKITNTLYQDGIDGDKSSKKVQTLKSSFYPSWKINRYLLLSKAVYFIYSFAVGGLKPFLPIYFKQLGINAKHLGILMGCRPLAEAFSIMIFSMIADRLQCHKTILITALCMGGLLTFAFNFIPIPSFYCPPDNITSDIILNTTFTSEAFQASPMYTVENPYTLTNGSYNEGYYFRRYGSIIVDNPYFTYDHYDLQESFICILVIIIICEMIAAPSLTLVDTYTLYQLEDKKVEYGRQRCWAAIGIGAGELMSGLILVHSIMTIEICGKIYVMGHNYNIAFSLYLILMSIAAVIALRFQFSESDNPSSSQINRHGDDRNTTDNTDHDDEIYHEDSNGIETKKLIRHYYHQYKNRLQNINKDFSESELDDDSDDAVFSYSTDSNDEMGMLAKLKDKRSTSPNQYSNVWQLFTSLRYGSTLCISLCLGTAMGILTSFMYWHLQSLGGSTLLFGCIGVTIHIVEAISFFLAQNAIYYLTHVGVMGLCIFLTAVVCMSLAFLQILWLAVPLGILIGMITALFFASATSYFSQAAQKHSISSAQGIFQAVYCGIGCSIGSVVGGIVITYHGARNLFFVAGAFYTIIFMLFILLQLLIHLSERGTLTDIRKKKGTNDPPKSYFRRVKATRSRTY
ncbi:Major facilitator superfamily domain-containing protein 6 [Trichoplax sp. H2]|nr:Major facilitator superfamily domain-containing protein 6 [Trichoplax sp. H2]|eukprot:RDD39512.1 Major facilitator superfamily domain-containing protein 6 [Trichoplax sp. H2]